MADGSIVYEVRVDDKGALQSIKQVGESAKESGAKGEDGFEGMGESIKKMAGIIAASMIVQKVLGIGKAAIDAYANYEQLVGGVETLFKDSAGTVQEYAANAYKTAGMSANQYMETVTSFSASLLQGLGGDTEAAAKYADTAITDMADNANKMGTSMESIQNAYQGFAKQNYTMLDNLKLGYGGTKSEMERLIADANRVKAANGEMADLSIDSYADIVEAIHTVQGEMGITGTTAEEAASTISGSAGMMQAAWENLLVGMVDSTADKSALIKQLMDSVKTFLGNLLPAIGSLIMGFIQSLPEILGQILDLAVQLLDDIAGNMPAFIESMVQVLGDLLEVIIDHIPQILEAGVRLVIGLGQGLVKAIPQLVQRVPEIIGRLFQAIVDGVGRMISAGIELLTGVKDGAEQGGASVLDWFAGLPGRVLGALGDVGKTLWNAGSQIIGGFFDGIKSAFGPVGEFVSGIGGWIQEHKGPEQYDKHLLVAQGQWIMQSLAAGLDSGRDDVMRTLQGITADIAGFSVSASLAPVGAGGIINNSTTVVNVNGMTAANPGVIAAGQSLASEIMLDLRMG